MHNIPIAKETTIKSSVPRKITMNETEEIIDCLARFHWYDMEADEREQFDACVRADLQKAAVCVLDTAQPDRTKIAFIVWSTNTEQFQVFDWDDKEDCNLVDFV